MILYICHFIISSNALDNTYFPTYFPDLYTFEAAHFNFYHQLSLEFLKQ